uniref:Uteroglobin n=1 Tax=Rhinolophus ferrumequinum TaxID=59479 RepID=A0A671FHJ1_RHIFE
MNLAITLALVTLAFCCSPASAEICTSFLHVIKTLFLGMLSEHEATIELFSPDADMRDAAMEKRLVDTLPSRPDSIMRLMNKMLKSPLCAY